MVESTLIQKLAFPIFRKENHQIFNHPTSTPTKGANFNEQETICASLFSFPAVKVIKMERRKMAFNTETYICPHFTGQGRSKAAAQVSILCSQT